MYQITSTKWNSLSIYNQVHLITKQFTSDEFAKKYNGPISVLPGMNMLVLLRNRRSATLEIVENLDTGTVYRIRQSGVVVATTLEYVDTIYPDLETYRMAPMKGNVIFKFPVKEIVYTIRQDGYETTIIRHKKPRFTGTVEITDSKVLDGPIEKHIEVNDVSWIDPIPDSFKEIDSVMKKTILFIRANFHAAKVHKPKRVSADKPPRNKVSDANPNVSKEDLRNAAKELAKHLSPKYALSDPDTGEHLARGKRTATPDQDTP